LWRILEVYKIKKCFTGKLSLESISGEWFHREVIPGEYFRRMAPLSGGSILVG
jgi:hypothetical protein